MDSGSLHEIQPFDFILQAESREAILAGRIHISICVTDNCIGRFHAEEKRRQIVEQRSDRRMEGMDAGEILVMRSLSRGLLG